MNKLIGLMMLVIGVYPIAAQKPLTAEESVKIALQRNVSLMTANENLKSSESAKKSAYGSLLPSVNGSAGWNYSKSVYGSGSLYQGAPTSTIDSRTYSTSVNSEWTVYDGLSNYASLFRGEKNFEAAKYELLKLKQDVVFQTLSYFYDLLDAQKLLSVKEEDLKWNKKNYEIIVEKNKLGALTLADVYQQQVNLGNAELELIKAKNNYQSLQSSFLYYLGLDVLEEYSFVEPIENTNENQPEAGTKTDFEKISNLVSDAAANRADYTSAKLQVESASESIKIAQAGYLPVLTNSIAISSSVGSLKNLFSDRDYSFGLNLSIPIFRGWAIDNQVQLAEVAHKVKQIQLDDLTRQIKRDIQKNYLDLQASYKRLEVSRETVKAAEENRRIEEEKYSLGATTLLNVLIANSSLTNASTGLINAKYEFRKLKDQTEYLLGKLDYQKFEK